MDEAMKEYEHEYAEYLYAVNTFESKGETARIVRGGISEAKPGYRSGPRRIECYSIHFVREGSLVIEFGNERERLKRGDLFCLYPNRTYTYYRPAGDEEPLRLCWLAIDGAGAEAMLKPAGFDPDFPIVRGAWNEELDAELTEIYGLLRREPPETISRHFELKGALYKLFARLVRANGDPATAPPAGWVQACADYIEQHASEGISVRQVAQMAGVNRTYLSTVFARAFGVPPAEYIYRVRIDRAKELLRGTSASITEIAYSLGYPTLFTFTRAFKKYCNMSPTEYRGRNRSPDESGPRVSP